MDNIDVSKQIDQVLEAARKAVEISQRVVERLESLPERPLKEYRQYELTPLDQAKDAAQGGTDALAELAIDIILIKGTIDADIRRRSFKQRWERGPAGEEG